MLEINRSVWEKIVMRHVDDFPPSLMNIAQEAWKTGKISRFDATRISRRLDIDTSFIAKMPHYMEEAIGK